MLIDFVPTVGGVSLAEAPAFKKSAGGAPANVAVGISRLGGSSAFIGKVKFYISFCSSCLLFDFCIFLLHSFLHILLQDFVPVSKQRFSISSIV